MNDIAWGILAVTLLILLLIAVIAITFFIAAQQRSRQEMELANTRIRFEQEIRQVETEVSEYMMSQFSQELHDNIGQLLAVMHIQIQNLKIDTPALSERLQPLELYVGEVTQQLRMLSRTLNNDYIGHIGLLASLQMEVDRLQTLKRFEVHLTAHQGPSTLDRDHELMVFRIFQEIVHNALRHSGAANLAVTLSNRDNSFEMQVADDGKGFDKDAVFLHGKASGLRNIVKRAAVAGLSCEINTTPGKGTLFILKKLPT